MTHCIGFVNFTKVKSCIDFGRHKSPSAHNTDVIEFDSKITSKWGSAFLVSNTDAAEFLALKVFEG
jgi:hypothetical protein